MEHQLHVVKNSFKYKETRYKGLAKQDTQLNVLFALGNLYMVRGRTAPIVGKGRESAMRSL